MSKARDEYDAGIAALELEQRVHEEINGKIKVGCRVMLNSGGPTMTVVVVADLSSTPMDTEVTCVWMSGYGAVSAGAFPLATIKRDRRND